MSVTAKGKAFEVSMPGSGARTFDSFECAIHALAPACEHCGVKVIGHGVEADGSFYCCAYCASMTGQSGLADRACSAFFSGTPSRFREVVP